MSTLSVATQGPNVCATMRYSDGGLFAEGCFRPETQRPFPSPVGVGHLYYPSGQELATIEAVDQGDHSIFWGITRYWTVDGRLVAEIRPRPDLDSELNQRFPDVRFSDWLQQADGFRPCPDDRAMFLSGPHWAGMEGKRSAELVRPFTLVCHDPIDDYFRPHLRISPFGEVERPDGKVNYFQLVGEPPSSIMGKARELQARESERLENEAEEDEDVGQ